jgi:putative thioredoxin
MENCAVAASHALTTGERRCSTISRMDVTSQTFDLEVVEASKTLPVVVDFWAPWCGPCRALGPVLDKVAAALGDRVKLVKINSDENPEISQAFNIRSIPNVIAFRDGRAVAQFTGALPEPQVRAFFAQLLPSEGEEALRAAEVAFAADRIDEAAQLLALVPRDFALEERIATLEQGLEFARAGASGVNEAELREKVGIDPLDHESRLALANFLAGQRRYRAAMDELLEIIRLARHWQDGAARTRLLALFALSNDPALVAEYRRKLASALH